jgi:glycerol-3-phosphate O-acyltransferase
LREGLKFEFFFRERPLFEQELEAELDRITPRWRELLLQPGTPTEIHRSIFGLGIGHAVLRPFIEAHHVVADALLMEPVTGPLDERAFLDKCQRLGRQYLLQGELKSPESVSKPLFQTSLQLARNTKLVEPGPDLADRRAAFARQVSESLSRIGAIEAGSGNVLARDHQPGG